MSLPVLFLILGIILSIVGSIMLIVAAFQESVVWGICYLFVPFASLVFLFCHWAEAKKGFAISILGGILFFVASRSMGVDLAQVARAAASGDAKTTALLNKQFAAQINHQDPAADPQKEKKAEIDGVKADMVRLEEVVNHGYAQLAEKRKTLNSADPAAVKAFNADAAAYNKDKSVLAEKKATLNRLWKELEAMASIEDRKTAAIQTAKVTVYTTQRCPYCVQAKNYLTQKGIPFIEKDVDASQLANMEFTRLGGRGVPLIVINGQQKSGFSPQWIDQMLSGK